jgi:hypothetical protein
MGTMETGRYGFNNYNNPFEQLKPSLEDARNHPELQLPPKIEAALEDAKDISAYVDPFDGKTRRMASFGACPELSAIDPRNGLSASSALSTMERAYRNGEATVADVVRMTLATVRLDDYSNDKFISVPVIRDWIDTFCEDMAEEYRGLSKEDIDKINAANNWLDSNRGIIAEFLSKNLYKKAENFMIGTARTITEFDSTYNHAAKNATRCENLRFDALLEEKIQNNIIDQLRQNVESLREQAVKYCIRYIVRLEDGGILEPSKDIYDYSCLVTLNNYSSIPEIKKELTDPNTIEKVINNIKALSEFTGSITDNPDIENFTSLIEGKAKKATYPDPELLGDYQSEIYYKNTTTISPEDEDYQSKRDFILNNETYRQYFTKEIEYVLDPYVLAHTIINNYLFNYRIVSSIFNIATSEDKEFIEALGLSDESQKIKSFLDNKEDSEKKRKLALLNLLPEDTFTDNQKNLIVSKYDIETIYKDIADASIGKSSEIKKAVSTLFKLLEECDIEVKVDEETVLDAAYNTDYVKHEPLRYDDEIY